MTALDSTTVGEPMVRVTVPETGIAVVRLDRPERLNAMSADLLGGLHDMLDRLAAEELFRVVVLTGNGRRFCAGLDLTAFGLGDRNGTDETSHRRNGAQAAVYRQAGPETAVAATAGGRDGKRRGRRRLLALALASDVRIGADSATFDVACVRLGLSGCDIGTSLLLPHDHDKAASASMNAGNRSSETRKSQTAGSPPCLGRCGGLRRAAESPPSMGAPRVAGG